MTDETCEGFKNYPTSTIALTIDNDEQRRNYIHASADSYRKIDLLTPDEIMISFAEFIKSYVEMCFTDNVTEQGHNVVNEFINYAMGTVDWLELAKHWISQDMRFEFGDRVKWKDDTEATVIGYLSTRGHIVALKGADGKQFGAHESELFKLGNIY